MPLSSDSQPNEYPKVALEGARDIRLVRVLYEPNSPQGLGLELSTTSLDNPAPFIALSYTWESAELDPETGEVEATVKYPIACHNGRINVTGNLLDFLQRAQEATGLTEKRYWIDQISINQSNGVERTHQIAMMGSIYKAAESVHIWLGKNDPSPQFLWVCRSFIPSLLQLDHELGDKAKVLQSDSWDCSAPELINGLGPEVCQQWRECREEFFWFFYTRRWFLRAWIVQEVTLKDVGVITVYCGKEEFTWKIFNDFTQFLERCSWHHSLPFLYVPWAEKVVGPMVPLLNLLKNRRYIDMQNRGGAEFESWKANFIWDIGPQDQCEVWYSILLHFLRITRFMSAGDPRDHVYSLLGMMEEFLPSSMDCPISPDYKVSVTGVFKDVAIRIFENTPSLYLLSTVSYGLDNGVILQPNYQNDWPSWVPDFANETTFHPSLSTTVYMVSGGNIKYNTARLGTVEYAPPTVCGDVLTVEGAQLSLIEKRNDRRPVLSGSENLPFLIFILELCILGASKYPGSDQTWLEAIWRTLMVDCIPPDWNIEPSVLFRSWLLDHIVRAMKFKGAESSEAPFLISQERVVRLLLQVSEDPHLSEKLPTVDEVVQQVRGEVEQDAVEKHPFELLACDSFRTGRLYLTKSGYLGSGPTALLEGDEVWLLKGSKMPMILRPTDNKRYLLVGESYLHGTMYGEMMTDERIRHMCNVEII